MTTKELIEKLQEYPEDAIIQIDSDWDEATRSELKEVDFFPETNIVALSDY